MFTCRHTIVLRSIVNPGKPWCSAQCTLSLCSNKNVCDVQRLDRWIGKPDVTDALRSRSWTRALRILCNKLFGTDVMASSCVQHRTNSSISSILPSKKLRSLTSRFCVLGFRGSCKLTPFTKWLTCWKLLEWHCPKQAVTTPIILSSCVGISQTGAHVHTPSLVGNGQPVVYRFRSYGQHTRYGYDYP